MTESLSDYRGPVVLFDGYCNLCSWSVRFLQKIDRRGVLRFVPLQDAFKFNPGLNLLGSPKEPGSILLHFEGKVYKHSDAVLKIFSLVGGGWKTMTILRIIPRPVRDAVYHLIARNRYRWFGKRNSCMIPTPPTHSSSREQQK